jgi:peptide/nickel transport system substrate-binding protein
METGRGYDGATRGVTSRRSLLKGLTSLIAVGAVAQLATTSASAAVRPSGVPKVDAKLAVESTSIAAVVKQAVEPKLGGTLKWAVLGEPPVHDPVFSSSTATIHIGWHVYEGLFTRDANNAPKMDLLEKYEPSNDGKKVTMALRKGVLFHNGKELTSADVEASLARFGVIQAAGRAAFDTLASMTLPDKYTVVLEFKEPRAGILPIFLSRIAAAITPLEDAQEAGRNPIGTPIGTGPYKFVEHRRDVLTRLQRFDEYVAREDPADGPGGKKVAYIDEIQFIPVPEEPARVAGMGSGEYHFADSLDLSSYARVKELPDVEADIGKPYYWAVAHMNKKEGLFTNVKLRQAVLAAISIDPIAAAAFGVPEFYRIDPGIAAPETPWFTDEGKELFN